MSVRVRWPGGAVVVVLGSLATPALAASDGAFTLEGPVAAPLIAGQRPWTRPGALPAAAVYLSKGDHLLGGLRLRSGILPGVADDERAGFVSLTLAGRWRPFLPVGRSMLTEGAWVEGVAGVNLTGGKPRPTAEGAIGYGFRIGAATLGPALRFLQSWERSGSRDISVALVGLDLAFSTKATFRSGPPPVLVHADARRLPQDRDKDGIVDIDDKCPLEAEDQDGFEDLDGCPEPDNDHDGIADADDKCPNQPENINGFEDSDGCPEPDRDRDGIADAVDKCPDEPEVVNGIDDSDGCPDQGVIQMVDNRIVLDATVLFDQDRARVRTAARAHLTAIVTLWHQHPEWERMIIEGHTDARGPDRYNDWLSAERAARVKKALVGMGVPAEKMEVKGMGRSHPVDTSDSEEAHRRNRRVEFVIVGPGHPATAATGSPGSH
jgi:outer membrane protein OmpA-like peptidoglycan-associated protein